MAGPVFQNDIQLGMVRTYFVNAPELSVPHNSPWLAPKGDDNEHSKDKAIVEVPTAWLGFFQSLLQAPAQHKWAK